MEELQPFGLGFVGCGSYNSSLAAAAAESPNLKMAACYDTDPERAGAFAAKFGLDACDDLGALLEREDVHGLVIATPNSAHRGNLEAAAAAGKHVFVDKPIANSIEDAQAMIDAAGRAGLTLAVGHNGRRMGGHRVLKRMIDDGAIGTPVTVEANFSHSGGLGLTPEQWRFYRDECPGLPLMQLGIHFADTVQYLLGDVIEVSSFMSRVATPADNNDVTVSLLKFANGLLGYLGSNYASPPVYYVNVYGTGGNLYCEGGGRVRYRKADAGAAEDVPVEAVNTQREELEEFADCARTGRKPEVDGVAALKALAVVRAALSSHAEGRPVTTARVISEGGASD